MKLFRILTIVAMSAFGALQAAPAVAQTTTINRIAYENNQIMRQFGKIGIGLSMTWVEQVGTAGLEVLSINPDSPAAKSGLELGDIITVIDDRILMAMELQQAKGLLSIDTGLVKKLTVNRNGVTKHVELNLEGKPLGLLVHNTKPMYHARIDRVLDGLPAQKAGLQAGDLVLAVDSQTLTSLGSSQELQNYFEFSKIGEPVKVVISRNMQVHQITVVRSVIPNVSAKYGVQTFHNIQQTGPFAQRDWTELSLWNLDWPDLLNAEFKVFPEQKGNALDYALSRIASEDNVVWNLKNNNFGNNPEQTARIIARFMKIDGWVLSYHDNSNNTFYTYTLQNGILTKAFESVNGDESVVVETGIKRFNPKLAILVNEKTASGSIALAYALRLSRSATIVGQQPFGSTSIVSYLNPEPELYLKSEVGSYRMSNFGGIGVSVDVNVDSISASNAATAAGVLIKPTLKWWEDGERFFSIVTKLIGGIVLFSFICIAVLFTPKSNGFPGLRLRNVALGFLVVEVTVIAAMAFVVMLTQMFWPTMIVFTLAVGVMVGRSMPSK